MKTTGLKSTDRLLGSSRFVVLFIATLACMFFDVDPIIKVGAVLFCATLYVLTTTLEDITEKRSIPNVNSTIEFVYSDDGDFYD